MAALVAAQGVDADTFETGRAPPTPTMRRDGSPCSRSLLPGKRRILADDDRVRAIPEALMSDASPTIRDEAVLGLGVSRRQRRTVVSHCSNALSDASLTRRPRPRLMRWAISAPRRPLPITDRIVSEWCMPPPMGLLAARSACVRRAREARSPARRHQHADARLAHRSGRSGCTPRAPRPSRRMCSVLDRRLASDPDFNVADAAFGGIAPEGLEAASDPRRSSTPCGAQTKTVRLAM